MDSATKRLSGVQSAAAAQDEYERVLASDERVEHAYQLNRDHFVFTDRRLILIEQQGITATKFKYHSIPYRSITHFAIETEGSFELDAELRIWISSLPTPIQKQFNQHLSVYEVQSVLAGYVLK